MIYKARNWENLWFEMPTRNEVKRYFITNKFDKEDGEVFYYCLRIKSWRWESGEHIGDWKAAADSWMWNLGN